MKKYIYVVAAIVFMTSCNQGAIDKANREKDSIQSVVYLRDSSIYAFTTAFDEVERNLDAVAAKQQIINSTSDKSHGELKPIKKELINAQISSINELMSENRKKIEGLTKKLKGSGVNAGQFAKTIATLNNQLIQKGNELGKMNLKLVSLNSRVATLQTSVDTLSDQNYMKSLTIDEETQALHTSFYVIGTKKELKEAKIIDRKGGLLGIGRTSKLNNNFDNTKFTRIDYTVTTSIPLNGNDIKIITSHPSGSYTLEKDKKDEVKTLVITNPSIFWSASKYLVIEKR